MARGQKTKKPRVKPRWRGVLQEYPRSQRLSVFLLLAGMEVAFVFSQIGMLGISSSGNNSTYIFTVLAPLTVAAFLLGVFPGFATGCLTGVAMAIHANVQPLDYIELIGINRYSTPILLGVTGTLLGLVFAIALRRKPKGWRMVLRVGIICFVMSFFFSFCYRADSAAHILFDYATNELAVTDDEEYTEEILDDFYAKFLLLGDNGRQVELDACLMVLSCLVAYVIAERLGSDADKRHLSVTFGSWLFSCVLLGYLFVNAWGFVSATNRELGIVCDDIREEFIYLDTQRQLRKFHMAYYVESVGDGTSQEDLDEILEGLSTQNLLEGYSITKDGLYVIAAGTDENATIVATTDNDIEVGGTIAEELEPETIECMKRSLAEGKMECLAYDYVTSNELDSPAVATFGYLIAQSSEEVGKLGVDMHMFGIEEDSGDYLYIAIKPSTLMFEDRGSMVVWIAEGTFVLMATVYLVVSHLLKVLVSNPLAHVGEELGGICEGQLDNVVDAHGSVEFVNLSSGINVTVDTLKEWIAEAERRIDEELEAATSIQCNALPSRFPPFPEVEEFDLFANMNPAREVGGDFYDFFMTTDGKLAFLIADVSGKGIPGALFMMEAKAELNNFLVTGMDVAEAVKLANLRLCEGNDKMFVTAWVAMLDYHTGKMSYVNAGHNPPLLWHKGEWVWLKNRSGLIMGSFESAKYRNFELTLEPGDELLLYTDGVTEAFNTQEEEYGNDRLEAFLTAHGNLGPQELVDALRAEVSAWTEGAVQSDDITMLVLKYCPDEA